MRVRLMAQSDLNETAEIHQLAFVRQKQSYEWLVCNFNAFPRVLCFVAEENNKIIGYILWTQKSGFRPEVVMEIEQLAVAPIHQGKGIGRCLILNSLPLVKEKLAENDSVLKHVFVTTRADNHAQELYRSTLGAEVEATITNLYSADEILMIARDVS
ncbi:3-oxoacyl-ACP synthase [Vibrio renipiscarius]|uniref:3-oxoacyl-ACP synthase n=2 Tax=Vibrio renipiscarius TaxID=1461322 RepID=A0A0C2JN93_9VIBR|nr:3-oxoacyl-ACP synthase [Vibrio renipiscarius]KII80833.1 3-oxoacyl-ACP synthase [Vibrio renipiscarius]